MSTYNTYKINFLDAQENVLWSKTDVFYDAEEAILYADAKMAQLNMNDLFGFEIYDNQYRLIANKNNELNK